MLILEHLVSEGLLDPDEILSSEFAVRDLSRRNRLTLVETATRTIAVKALANRDSHRRESAALHALGQSTHHFAVPILIGTGADYVLTRTDAGLVTLPERWPRGLGVRGAQRLARALAELHVRPSPGLGKAAMNIDGGGASVGTLDAAPGFRAAIRLLQRPAIRRSLLALDVSLRAEPEVFTHGDVRAANVLFGGHDIWLIDWETAGADCRWRDVGAVIAMLVEDAIERGDGPPPPRVIRGFVHEYEMHCGVASDTDCVVQIAGARLLQFAMERGQSEWPVGPHSRAIASAGVFFLLHPHDGARRLGLAR